MNIEKTAAGVRRESGSSSHNPPRRAPPLAGVLVFIVGLAITLALTIGGAHELVQHVTAAGSLKSGIITLVVGLGLVLIGPVLLLALIMMLPRWWFRDVWSRRSNHDNAAPTPLMPHPR